MCIIAAKAAGIPMPNRERIKTMWDGNRDGAGLMYVENGQVRIEKGFMKYKDFTKVLDRLEKRLDLTATPVVMHFRITTHGGTKPENCHPFPITDNVGALKKLTITTDLGVAHNGIIPISPRKGISDTMEYIASQLAPLKKALPRFYENKNAMLLIKNAIESKMAFLTKEGGGSMWAELFIFWCFAPAVLPGCRLVMAMLRLIKSLALAELFSRRT